LLRVADLRVDPALDEVRKDGQTIKLGPKTMQLLMCLADRAGEVLSVDDLLNHVWKGVVVSPDSVYAAVAALRRQLDDDPKKPKYIANVVRRGYRLIAPVSPWVDAPAAVTAELTPAPDQRSIAVLPFVNLSGDPAQEYFSDGITWDIITELARWRRLAVRSRSSSFRYRGAAVDTLQAARELNVSFIVEGSVRRIGERIRINVQLIDTEIGSQIWTEKFDRKREQIFKVQDRVVQTIVSTLVGRVEASDTERARRKPPTSLAAHDYVLRANALPWDEPAGASEAISLVEKAIELDPAYAMAYALLAALSYSRWDDGPRGSEAALEKAYLLAKRAVELDDGESTCHAILGHVCALRGSFDLALHYCRRAVQLNPSNQWNAGDFGSTLTYRGEFEEALTWLSKAREIDPYFDEPWFWRAAGLCCMSLDRYEEALSNLGRVQVQAYPYAALIAACHARLGEADRANRARIDCLAQKPDFSIARFMRREPFRFQPDADKLAASLRMAGLPD